jgi:glutamyl-tRNA synthetase
MTVIARFAPSPTGYLHLGNIRTAIVNWLFVKQQGGKFILRIDDTDSVRSKEEYFHSIVEDLAWLGLDYAEMFRQSERMERYNQVRDKLIEQGRLYPCFESSEELEMKRKTLLSRGLPPIYDRAALKLSGKEIEAKISEGIKPHYRFKLAQDVIEWDDLIRGKLHFEPKNLGDPILIREDGSMTYMLCSCIDDIDMSITHVFRGEDHISNTAVGVQLHRAIGGEIPRFAHLSLLKTKTAEMSKRVGGFDIKSLREQHLDPMAINSLLARLGTAQTVEPYTDMNSLISEFDIGKFGKAAANYDFEDLKRLNHKIIAMSSFERMEPFVSRLGIPIDSSFFEAIKTNINVISELRQWHEICNQKLTPVVEEGDREFLKMISGFLPQELDSNSWDIWINEIKERTDRRGRNLFMPIRLALTGSEDGPELKLMLPLIARNVIVKRLSGEQA